MSPGYINWMSGVGKVKEEVDKCHFIRKRKLRRRDQLLSNGELHLARNTEATMTLKALKIKKESRNKR